MQRRGPEARLAAGLPNADFQGKGAAQAWVGKCRVCGCTSLAPCQDNGDGVPCSWLDPRGTLCDNIQCIAKIPLDVLERLLEERTL
jgi:hypothetical protein